MKHFSILLLVVFFSISSLSAQQISKTNKNNEKEKSVNAKSQDSISSADNELQEIVVSASRKAEILDEVPSSVTLLSKKQIQQQLSISSNLSDILGATVPGLGFTTNRTQNLGQTLRGRRVLVMIDGIPQSTPLRDGAKDMRSLDPTVLDRVEVIKGATAIYGNGADGGLINYITKKANTDKAISGSTELGTAFSLIKPKGTAGFFVSQLFTGKVKKLDYVVSGRYEETGLYRDAKGRVLSPEYGMNDLKNWNAFAKIGYDFNDNNRLEFMYNYFESTQHTDYVAKAGVYGNFDSPTTGVKGQRPGDPEGTPYNHNASLSYIGKNLIGKTDLNATLYFQDYLTLINYSDFFENNGQPATQSKKFGFRLNLNTPYEFSSLISGNLTYGLDILSDVTDTHLTDNRVVIPEMNMTNLAPYFQLKNMFGPNLVLKTGLRLENVNIDVPDYTTIGIRNYVNGTYVGGGIAVNGGALDFSALMFNAGLRYTKWSLFKPFVSFSQSFSVADLGLVLRAAKENTVSNTSIKAVTANNYEFGFSGAFDKLTYEGAVYYSTSKLGASYVYVDGNPQISRSPEKIYGFELSAKYRLHPKVDIGANYSFTEGKRELADKKVYLGGDRINPPKIAAYTVFRPLEAWSIFLQMTSTTGRDRFEPVNGAYTYGTGPIKSFTAFNLSSSYTFREKSTFRFGVENLFNKDYYTVISQWQSNNMNYVKENGTRLTVSFTQAF
ncbi:TonB-dependent receptor [Flavobacterium sp. ov086]|uniref:TonB-dependent receptor n=1 Tax=Flavobacterium sp. ov086 TaxID=1761785 RepID=UPI000B6C94FF|nr:TonB-dependent receptor [Flavobacterium sp. ov086]SNR40836.1 iron complex outermembrane recepter protein [Flavobacterium sp. ov086]